MSSDGEAGGPDGSGISPDGSGISPDASGISPDAEALARARARWRHRGDVRPPFAHEPAAGQESVWDYPRPPRIERDRRCLRVELAGVLVAESTRSLRVLETASPPTFYLPPDDVRLELLVAGHGTSLCEWKGVAEYWSLRVEAQLIENAAWCYREPYLGFEPIRDHIAFYPARVECRLNDERVRPQPGAFYAGWVTRELSGPFKGEPGSEDW